MTATVKPLSGGAPIAASIYDREAIVVSPVNVKKEEKRFTFTIQSAVQDLSDTDFQIHLLVNGKNLVGFPAFELLSPREGHIPASLVCANVEELSAVQIVRRNHTDDKTIEIANGRLPVIKGASASVKFKLTSGQTDSGLLVDIV